MLDFTGRMAGFNFNDRLLPWKNGIKGISSFNSSAWLDSVSQVSDILFGRELHYIGQSSPSVSVSEQHSAPVFRTSSFPL